MRHAVKSFLAGLLLFPIIATAQLNVKNLYGITGKKDAAVQVICQDLTGFLFLATTDGLYQFDGKTAVALFPDKFRSPSLITALFTDSKDVIWIGTSKGKVYTYDHHKLDSLTFPTIEEAEKITSFCELKNTIYAGSYGNGLFQINNKTVKQITTKDGLSDNVIYQVKSDGAKNVWCATDAGISEITEGGKGIQVNIFSTRNGLQDNIVRDLFIGEKKLIIAMQDSGICYLNFATKEIEKPFFFKNWTLGPILNVFENKDGSLYLATEREGLVQIKRGEVTIYKYGEHLKADHISQMFCDREKSYWFASPKGLSHMTENRYHIISTGQTPEERKVMALVADNNRVVWVATAMGYSRMYRDEQGKTVLTKIPGYEDYITSCGILGPDGKVWFGTYGHGILVMESGAKPIVLNVANGNLTNDNVSGLFFGDNDIVYVATLGGGILKGHYDEDKRSLEKLAVYTENEGLGSNYVYAAITGTDGLLYAATDGGGLQILIKNKFYDLTKKFGFQSNSAFSLCRDPSGHITSTSNADGLLHWDGKVLKRYRANDGLRDEQPAQIISSNNNLLCIHSKGIDKLNCMNNVITYYDLPESDFEANLNAIAYRDGWIYSGTTNGIITYRTSKETNDSIKPIVYFKQFFLNYKPFPLDSIYEFKSSQNSMGFAFDGIWLKRPDQLRFRYKLVGLEDEWQYSDEGKTVNYNNLSPGNYSFIVQVQNDEDVWSSPDAHAFIILTPIYKRWWFWLIVVVGGSFGVVFFVRYRLKALQKENLLLERRVKERTHQIERQTKIIEEKNIALEQLSLVASKTDNVVLILDPQGKLEYINESFEKINGMNLEQLTAKFGSTIFELSNNPDIRTIVQDAIDQKRSVNYESLNVKVPGKEIWQSSTLTPIFDENGDLRKIIIIDTDVTIRKRQEQIILQKNKDITDSISYARKIQTAILPTISQIRTYIPNSFVLYMTKDIVSGDFFWFDHFEDYSIIAAVDCTGHGVPGAFMSLIGYNQLNRIVNEQKIHDPALILEALNKGVLNVIHKNESESKDGMDLAICKIDHKRNKVQYAGAMRPLWIVSDTADGPVFIEHRADKIPIGTKPSERSEGIHYTTHDLDYKKGDHFYIFTDGYADQFGGEKDKKYSTGRLRDLLLKIHSKSIIDQEQEIRTEHATWKGPHEQVDDILVIGFSLNK